MFVKKLFQTVLNISGIFEVDSISNKTSFKEAVMTGAVFLFSAI
jgi:hypothetical protein